MQYDDLDGLEADFFLLCKNAQAYNEDSSLIFEDSIVLQSVFTNAREKLKGEWENEKDDEEEMMAVPEGATPAGSTTGAIDEDAPVVTTPKKGRKPRKDKGEPKSTGRGKGRKKKVVVSDDEDDEDF